MVRRCSHTGFRAVGAEAVVGEEVGSSAGWAEGVEVDDTINVLRLLHPRKAHPSMEVSPSGKVMLRRLLHPEKAPPSIEVSLSGKLMLRRLLHPWKA